MKLLKWQWFDVAFGDPYREGRTPALLLLGIYLADRKGKPFTKGKVCAFACVDHATTGPKFIYRFQEHGLITVSYRPGDRRRRSCTLPTSSTASSRANSTNCRAGSVPTIHERDRSTSTARLRVGRLL